MNLRLTPAEGRPPLLQLPELALERVALLLKRKGGQMLRGTYHRGRLLASTTVTAAKVRSAYVVLYKQSLTNSSAVALYRFDLRIIFLFYHI